MRGATTWIGICDAKRRGSVMRLRDFTVVGVGLSVLLACGGLAAGEDIGEVIEEIEALQAERLEVLRTVAEESETEAREAPDSAPTQASAKRAVEAVDGAARAHQETLEKLREVGREGNWEQAYPVLRLMINDGRPVAIVRALRDQAEADLAREQARLEERRAYRERQREQRAEQEKRSAERAAELERWSAARAAAEAAAEARVKELVAAAPARRAELEARLVAVEEMYEEVYATHEEAAAALTDKFEARWARDRIPRDRTMMEYEVGGARRRLEGARDVDLDRVERSVKGAENGAAGRLEAARVERDKARGR